MFFKGDGLPRLPNTETDPAADAEAHAEAHAAHTVAYARADTVLHGLLVWLSVPDQGCGYVHRALFRQEQRWVPKSARPKFAVF